jgi:hypothetical protein
MALGMMEGLVLQWFFDKKGFDLEEAYAMCVDFMNVYLMPPGQEVDVHAMFKTQSPSRPRHRPESQKESALGS